jgi:formylglycine-generating enzyme required for sulfatase activity
MLVVIGPDWANLSHSDGTKRLFDPKDVTRWEVETGLRRSREGTVTVIPVLVLDAPIPSSHDLPDTLQPLLEKNVVRLRNFPDFNTDVGRLVHDIRKSQGFMVDDIPVAYFEPRTLSIAEGTFSMGSPSGAGISLYESPQHQVTLPSYRIGQFPVTNAQFEEYILEMKREVPRQMGWDGQNVPKGLEKHPVTGVTWYEAIAYCGWLSQKTGRSYLLPSEAQWEKACRAGGLCTFPWGDEFEPDRCNHGGLQVTPVDQYPAQNGFGCYDLVGNVLQWTCTIWEQEGSPGTTPYPWQEDGRNDLNANSETPRVIRGSSMKDDLLLNRCSARRGDFPNRRGFVGARYGFRLVMKV